MTKPSLQPVVVTPAAVAQALATSDDFGHEMRVRAILERGATIEHGWAYVDPVEGKPRQFDLRARMPHYDRPRRINMAVECKNLAAEAPLVISGTARTRAEAFHHYVLGEADNMNRGVMNVWRDQPLYPLKGFVGKSIVRLKTEKGLVAAGPDAEIYKGWTQALASADQLCKEAIAVRDHIRRQISTLVLPVVVVPDGTLWIAEYQKDGTLFRPPEQTDSTTLFLNHEIVVVPNNYWMRLGHVHFFTLTGLEVFMTTLTARTNSWEDWFSDTAERYSPSVH